MDGILIIDKPPEWTSHDVVGKLRKLLKTKRIGHTGTLDPFATGVLVMLVGQATRLARFLDKDFKEYEATIQFGFETDTGDLTGTPRGEKQTINITNAEIERVLPDFMCGIEQIPPMYSAKKIDGQKLYTLARQGIEIKRDAVKITIEKLELIPPFNDLENDRVKLRVVCSAGTYIRTLAEEIGRKLGMPCHLSALKRVRAGQFSIEQAKTIEQAADAEFISLNDAVGHLPQIDLNTDEITKVRHGMKVIGEADDGFVRLTYEHNELIAIGDCQQKVIQPKIVFV